MRGEHPDAQPQRVQEALCPRSLRQRCCARAELLRELVVELDHERLLARVVAVEQAQADLRSRRDLAQRRLLEAFLREQVEGALEQVLLAALALAGSRTARSLTSRH